MPGSDLVAMGRDLAPQLCRRVHILREKTSGAGTRWQVFWKGKSGAVGGIYEGGARHPGVRGETENVSLKMEHFS